MLKGTLLLAMLILTSLIIVGCGGGVTSALPAQSVTFDINLIEIKGATDGIEAPSTDPESLSSGYKFSPPGAFDSEKLERWQVSSYMFSPSELVVSQGSEVTLRTFVLNGDVHVARILAPDGSVVPGTEITMNRGRQYEIVFVADQTGFYSWECSNHGPTMTAKILVLPGSG